MSKYDDWGVHSILNHPQPYAMEVGELPEIMQVANLVAKRQIGQEDAAIVAIADELF